MSGVTTAALISWAVLILGSVWLWLPAPGIPRPPLAKTWVLVVVVAAEVAVTGVVALLGALGPPLAGGWAWLAIGTAALAALLTGGAVTLGVLGLADASSRASVATARVQLAILRGGAWIGALERLALFAMVLSGFPEGIAAIVAVKAFARYPELKTGQASGAIERFIIGTFTSLGWAAVCAGVARVLTRQVLG